MVCVNGSKTKGRGVGTKEFFSFFHFLLLKLGVSAHAVVLEGGVALGRAGAKRRFGLPSQIRLAREKGDEQGGHDGRNGDAHHNARRDSCLLPLVHILEKARGKVAQANAAQVKQRRNVLRRARARRGSSRSAVGHGAVGGRRAGREREKPIQKKKKRKKTTTATTRKGSMEFRNPSLRHEQNNRIVRNRTTKKTVHTLNLLQIRDGITIDSDTETFDSFAKLTVPLQHWENFPL